LEMVPDAFGHGYPHQRHKNYRASVMARVFKGPHPSAA
jgi:hypothetical protein